MSVNGLWRKGAGTPADPDNGRLIWRILGICPSRWQPRRERHPRDLWPTLAYWPRTLWNELTRYAYETCNRCGRKIGPTIGDTYWSADDDLYVEVIGHEGGLFCPRCFTRAARRRDVSLWWQPKREDESR